MVERLRNGSRASRLLSPFTLILGQNLRLILRAKFAVPIGKLNGGVGQPFLDINLPAPDFDKAAGIGQPLTVPLTESPLYVRGLCLLAFGLAQDRQRRVLPIVTAMVRPVWQSVMVADQFAMKLALDIE